MAVKSVVLLGVILFVVLLAFQDTSYASRELNEANGGSGVKDENVAFTIRGQGNFYTGGPYGRVYGDYPPFVTYGYPYRPFGYGNGNGGVFGGGYGGRYGGGGYGGGYGGVYGGGFDGVYASPTGLRN